jgi:hypothetical protein
MQTIQRVLTKSCFLVACLLFGFCVMSVVAQTNKMRRDQEPDTAQCPSCTSTVACSQYNETDCPKKKQTDVDDGWFTCKSSPGKTCYEFRQVKCCPQYKCKWDSLAKICKKETEPTAHLSQSPEYSTLLED